MTAINGLVGSTLADMLAINTDVEALLASATEKRKATVQPFLDALAASKGKSARPPSRWLTP
jgi:hypothetical protein